MFAVEECPRPCAPPPSCDNPGNASHALPGPSHLYVRQPLLHWDSLVSRSGLAVALSLVAASRAGHSLVAVRFETVQRMKVVQRMKAVQ